jgi:hypothetical protein
MTGWRAGLAGWLAVAVVVAGAEVREVSPGVVEAGLVRVDQVARSLSFPAEVNQSEGMVEYLVVTVTGKTHESVFTTRAEPRDIHLAALLLGARDATKATKASDTNSPPALRGDAVRIEVVWSGAGQARTNFLEHCVRHVGTGQPLADGPWVYNGSELRDGRFAAQHEGSVVSIIDDVEALVNNPRPERENDDIWRVNDTLLPPKGTAVTITMRFPPPN